MKNVVGMGALPQTKIEHVGFLNLLQSQNKPQVLRLNLENGHRQSVQIKYLQRYTEDYAGTDESAVCTNTNFEAYKEASALLSSFRFFAVHIEDETIAKYEDDASNMISAGTPPTQLMNEFLERLMVGANAILGGVRTDLLTSLIGTGIGINRATGSAAAKSVNFAKDVTMLPLDEGINEILSDFSINLLSGNPLILTGAGSLFHKFMLQQYAKGMAQNGLNTAIEATLPKLFVDAKMTTLAGANQFLAIERDSVQIVEYLQYKGLKAGWKPGASQFGTIPLPMLVDGEVLPVEFDYQLRYNDCDASFVDEYYGTPMTLKKGYNIILSKKSGLFQIPADAYRAIDPNVGVNGVLRYTATNT